MLWFEKGGEKEEGRREKETKSNTVNGRCTLKDGRLKTKDRRQKNDE